MKDEFGVKENYDNCMTYELTEVMVKDLRALLFWATVGVCKSRGGIYETYIIPTIKSYAKEIGYSLGETPRFMR